MRRLKHSEEEVLLGMLKIYTEYCSKNQQRWRKSMDYPYIFKTWQDAKAEAKRVVDLVLEEEIQITNWDER